MFNLFDTVHEDLDQDYMIIPASSWKNRSDVTAYVSLRDQELQAWHQMYQIDFNE